MISFDYTIVYQIILFLILWVILNKVLFRPYFSLLEDRERKTLGARHEASDLEHEGESLKAQYEERVAQAQAAGNAAKEVILQDARQQWERLLTQGREEATHMLESVRQDVHAQMEKERQFAAAEVATVAQQIASKIIGRDVA